MNSFGLLFAMVLILSGCTKTKELPSNVARSTLMFKVWETDPNASLVRPDDMTKGVKCSDYGGEGCVGAHMVSIHGLVLIAVEFADAQIALTRARPIKAMVYRNWLFDDASDEPILKYFLETTIGAKLSTGVSDY